MSRRIASVVAIALVGGIGLLVMCLRYPQSRPKAPAHPALGQPASNREPAASSKEQLKYSVLNIENGTIRNGSVTIMNNNAFAWTNVRVSVRQGQILFSCSSATVVPARSPLSVDLARCNETRTSHSIDRIDPITVIVLDAREGGFASAYEPGLRIQR
jgi:hypothetical protein